MACCGNYAARLCDDTAFLLAHTIAHLSRGLSPACTPASDCFDVANSTTMAAAVNPTLQSLSNLTEHSTRSAIPTVAEHSIHVFADGALGMLIGKIIVRSILTAPSSRAAEACRRITADGYLQSQRTTRHTLHNSACDIDILSGAVGPTWPRKHGSELRYLAGASNGEQLRRHPQRSASASTPILVSRYCCVGFEFVGHWTSHQGY